jgi:hypothetical protein
MEAGYQAGVESLPEIKALIEAAEAKQIDGLDAPEKTLTLS